MKKSKFKLALITIITIIGLAAVPGLTLNEPNQVTAATVRGYVKVKTSKKVRLYKLSGKHSKFYAVPKRRYPYSSKKKIGENKRTAYKIGNNDHWILAKDVKKIRLAKKKSYVKAQLRLPAGYTRAELLNAYQGTPSNAFVGAAMKGMQANDFSRTKASESRADDEMQVDLRRVTPQQVDILTAFALRLINGARSDLNLVPWVDSSGTRKLAADIATEYAKDNKTIKDGHYVPGIVRACKHNGLALDDNYIEDMAGFYNQSQTMSMTELKKSVYFGLKQMIFGYTGSGEEGRRDRGLYMEWEHAGDLFNTQGTQHDGDYAYFGFSMSHTNNICSMHFISVPSYIVNNKKYNKGFRP